MPSETSSLMLVPIGIRDLCCALAWIALGKRHITISRVNSVNRGWMNNLYIYIQNAQHQSTPHVLMCNPQRGSPVPRSSPEIIVPRFPFDYPTERHMQKYIWLLPSSSLMQCVMTQRAPKQHPLMTVTHGMNQGVYLVCVYERVLFVKSGCAAVWSLQGRRN